MCVCFVARVCLGALPHTRTTAGYNGSRVWRALYEENIAARCVCVCARTGAPLASRLPATPRKGAFSRTRETVPFHSQSKRALSQPLADAGDANPSPPASQPSPRSSPLPSPPPHLHPSPLPSPQSPLAHPPRLPGPHLDPFPPPRLTPPHPLLSAPAFAATLPIPLPLSPSFAHPLLQVPARPSP